MQCCAGAGFGHAPGLHDLAAQPLLAGLLDFFAQRRGSRDHDAQRGEIVIIDDGLLCHRQHNWRGHVANGHVIVLHGLQELREIEARQNDDGGPSCQPQAQNHRESVDVEEGQHTNGRIRLGNHFHRRELADVRHQIAVRQHDAFRDASGAAGIGQRHHILAQIDVHQRRFAVVLH